MGIKQVTSLISFAVAMRRN